MDNFVAHAFNESTTNFIALLHTFSISEEKALKTRGCLRSQIACYGLKSGETNPATICQSFMLELLPLSSYAFLFISQTKLSPSSISIVYTVLQLTQRAQAPEVSRVAQVVHLSRLTQAHSQPIAGKSQSSGKTVTSMRILKIFI
jgi:hypothetical protein